MNVIEAVILTSSKNCSLWKIYLFGDENKLHFFVIYLESFIHNINCVQKVFISVVEI
jgi:hypothetical protein